MNKFVWTDEYSLGIGIIDEQHKHFFEIVNKIYDVVEKSKNDRAEIIKVVDELKNYALFHLSTEEKYFNQFAYSDIANHMKYHAAFKKQTGEFTDRINNAKEDLPKLVVEMADFAQNWLTKHILVADKMYAPFFKQHGL
jgi:hemerythrin-like metal-binding protein